MVSLKAKLSVVVTYGLIQRALETEGFALSETIGAHINC
jgi:hypothetical protein